MAQRGAAGPEGTLKRYRALEWLNFIATELHKTFSPLWRKDTTAELRATVESTPVKKFCPCR